MVPELTNLRPPRVGSPAAFAALFTVLFFLFVPTAQANAPKEVAVLNVEGEVVLPFSSPLVTNALVLNARKTLEPHGFRVLTAREMLDLADEQQRELSCSEEPCGLAYASQLGIPYVLTASSISAGSRLVLVLKLQDVEAGGLLSMQRIRQADPSNFYAELHLAMVQLLEEGLSLQTEPTAPAPETTPRAAAPPQPEPGRTNSVRLVKFVSTPRGAKVLLNGAAICVAAPCTREVEPGDHTLGLKLPHFEAQEWAVTIEPGRGTQVLSRQAYTGSTGKLRVRARKKMVGMNFMAVLGPDKASDMQCTTNVYRQLLLNGSPVGLTTWQASLPVGTHEIQLRGLFSRPKTVEVHPNTTTIVDLRAHLNPVQAAARTVLVTGCLIPFSGWLAGMVILTAQHNRPGCGYGENRPQRRD
jgi:hypothetical protein